MKLESHAVILAGGRGTRFWPRSRTRTPKQLLNIVGSDTMLRQTVQRIAPLFSPSRLWVVTQAEQADSVRRQLPRLPKSHLLVEPQGRNTAAAIALAAVHIRHRSADALMAVLPADQVVRRPARFRRILRAALLLAAEPATLVVIGIEPSRPETGFGYIERDAPVGKPGGFLAYAVRRFTEKPALPLARRYLASGRYSWNAGMFFWRASTFLDQLANFLPVTHRALTSLDTAIGSAAYSRKLARAYGRVEKISVDYAVLEPASRPRSGARVLVLPAGIGWNDIGSWAAVWELQARGAKATVSAGPQISLDAEGNYFWSPEKLVAAIGLKNTVVVETPDALLICPRSRVQEVAQIVRELERRRFRNLL